MASIHTRKELTKQDLFTVEAEHTVHFVATHRKQFIQYGVAAVAVAVIVAGVFYYRSSQLGVRQQALGEAIALSAAPVGQAQGGGASFPTAVAKDAAVGKAFEKVSSDYSGTEEAFVAEYYLAAQALNAGKVDDSRKKYQDVADHASANYASLARLSLAQLDVAENRNAEAETILKGLMDNPTDLVSKTQATFTYARTIAATRPDEARKLYAQIASEKSDVSQIAQTAMADLPQK